MKIVKHIIKQVEEGSIAESLGISPGDMLLKVNNKPIVDIFDYQYLINDTNCLLLIESANNEEWEYDIEKDYDEDIGLIFESSLMDDYKSCYNKCIFCFIDQMPPGMRETLYFKDDDTRLSFLQGNYVTLTNLKQKDIDRIIEYHLCPINISVHTTNPQLRCKMLNNKNAGSVLKYIDDLYKNEIPMNGQIVLCKGINDKAELKKTISDLSKYIPYMQSLSVVPSGLTKYRDKLFPLEPFNKEDACEIIDTIEGFQNEFKKNYDKYFVQASDEWYIKAERPIPPANRYEGYIQLENGVGMMRLLEDKFNDTFNEYIDNNKFDEIAKKLKNRHISLATGVLAYPLIKKLANKVMEILNQFNTQFTIDVYAIRNDFFGSEITVSGLITGQDLINQLKDINLGERLLLPCNMLRSEERVFLDDLTVEDLEKSLQSKVYIVKSSGLDMFMALTCSEDASDNDNISSAVNTNNSTFVYSKMYSHNNEKE